MREKERNDTEKTVKKDCIYIISVLLKDFDTFMEELGIKLGTDY